MLRTQKSERVPTGKFSWRWLIAAQIHDFAQLSVSYAGRNIDIMCLLEHRHERMEEMETAKTIKLDTVAAVNDIGKPWRYQEDGLTVTRTSIWSPPGCHPVGCGLKLYVDSDGKMVKVEGDENNPVTQGRLCPRCIAMQDYVYNPSRIIHPMKRDPKDRGKADKWVKITRDEAFDGRDAPPGGHGLGVSDEFQYLDHGFAVHHLSTVHGSRRRHNAALRHLRVSHAPCGRPLRSPAVCFSCAPATAGKKRAYADRGKPQPVPA